MKQMYFILVMIFTLPFATHAAESLDPSCRVAVPTGYRASQVDILNALLGGASVTRITLDASNLAPVTQKGYNVYNGYLALPGSLQLNWFVNCAFKDEKGESVCKYRGDLVRIESDGNFALLSATSWQESAALSFRELPSCSLIQNSEKSSFISDKELPALGYGGGLGGGGLGPMSGYGGGIAISKEAAKKLPMMGQRIQ